MNGPMDEARLVELAALPAGDPRRTEAERDPRVRAWLLEHEAFLAGGAPLAPGEADEVERAADAALARARAAASGAAPAVLQLPRAAVKRRGLPRWALAAAALAVVAGALVVLPRPGARREPAFRSLAPATVRLATGEPSRDDRGRMVLRWTPAPGADAHRVELLQGLAAVATFEVANADSLVLDPRTLPPGDGLLWRVLALRDGEVVETSSPRELPQ